MWGTPAPFASEDGPTPTTDSSHSDSATSYGAPDDPPDVTPESSHARFFSFRASPPAAHVQSGPGVPGNLSAAQAGDWLLGNAEERWQVCGGATARPKTLILNDAEQKMMALNYSYGIEKDPDQLAKNDDDHTKFSNPLEVRLPNAPVWGPYV